MNVCLISHFNNTLKILRYHNRTRSLSTVCEVLSVDLPGVLEHLPVYPDHLLPAAPGLPQLPPHGPGLLLESEHLPAQILHTHLAHVLLQGLPEAAGRAAGHGAGQLPTVPQVDVGPLRRQLRPRAPLPLLPEASREYSSNFAKKIFCILNG